MANYSVETVEGIGEVYGKKLREQGIKNTDQLLSATRTKAFRKELAEKTGIKEDLILKFANHVDLFRVNGIGPQSAEILEAAGVDTVKELATRKPENLVKKMEEVNAAKKLVRRVPYLKVVTKWVESAKTLPRSLEY